MADKEEESMMVVGKDGQLVKREFGMDEGAKEYASYEAMVDDINAQTTDLEHRELEINWEIGRIAYQIKEQAKYGNHGIDEFSKDINKSPSTIYTDVKIYKAYTLEDIQRMRDEDISLRRVGQLLRAPEQDRPLIEDIISNRGFRVDDATLKTLIDNSVEGVIIPEDEAGKQKYVEMCRDGGYAKKKDEEPEDEDVEEEAGDKAPVDPGEKFAANLRSSCDEMSLHLSQLEQDVQNMRNTIEGDLYKGLDDATKDSLNGPLAGLRDQLSKTLNKAFRFMSKLPGDTTKEADADASRQ